MVQRQMGRWCLWIHHDKTIVIAKNSKVTQVVVQLNQVQENK